MQGHGCHIFCITAECVQGHACLATFPLSQKYNRLHFVHLSKNETSTMSEQKMNYQKWSQTVEKLAHIEFELHQMVQGL
jgi:hypothetical protein